MNIITFHLTLIFWKICSVFTANNFTNKCIASDASVTGYADVRCTNITLYKDQNLLLENVTKQNVNVIILIDVKGYLDNSTLGNFTNIRSLMVYKCELEIFNPPSAFLENLQIYYSNFTNKGNFGNCCSNLMKLTLKNSQVVNLESEAFKNFKNLRQLHLIDQHIKHVTRNTFKGLRSLKKLQMTNIKYETIDADSFADLTKLKEFYLEDNNLESINENLFKPLKKLKTLTIYGKKLKPLALDMFSEQKNLRELGLPLDSWRIIDVERIPKMFPNLYSHSYIGEWENDEDKLYFRALFHKLNNILLHR